MLAILLTGLTVTASAASPWAKDADGNWTYTKADGKLAEDEWIKDGGKWYYFIGTLMAENEVFTDGKNWYAADKTGAMVSNGWFQEKFDDYSEWYYAGADGALIKGWKQIGGKWYFFDDWAGSELKYKPWMASGSIWTVNNTKYAFKPSGEMIVGWGQPFLGSQWYDQTDVDNVTNWVYANADGSLAIGWKKIDGKWYYFWKDGTMARNVVVWFNKGDSKYDAYGFNKSGAMIENGWFMDPDTEGGTEDWYYFGADGLSKKGWLKDKGKWYYLDADYGIMYHYGFELMSDGKTYYLDPTTGAMATGWKQIDDVWYFFKDSGARAEKEWVKSGSAWYYLKEEGEMAKDEILTIDGKPYKFDANGVWVP